MSKRSLVLGIIFVLVLVGVAWTSMDDSAPRLNLGGDTKVYVDSANQFEFDYPKYLSASETIDVHPETGEKRRGIVFSGKENEPGFQLYISAFDPDPITLDRVRRELPDLPLIGAEEIDVSGARGVVFVDEGQSDLQTREIWFSYRSLLYQITTSTDFDTAMADILLSWRWQ